MTALLASIAARYGLPKWVVVLVASLALLGLVAGGFGLWLSHHDNGVIESHETGIEARVQTQGRAADQNMMERKAERQAEAATDREEFNNATAHLPKSGLTARQRIDACNQLQRQGTDPAVLSRAGCL